MTDNNTNTAASTVGTPAVPIVTPVVPAVTPIIEPVVKTAEPAKTVEPATPNLPKTQDEMDAIVKDRVARAKVSAREEALKDPTVVAAFNAQKALNELARAGMTEPEKIATDLKAAQERAATALKENAELKAYQLKQAALSKANLPLTFADRIHGNTEEEITTDLNALVAELKTLSTTPVNISGNNNPAGGGGGIAPTIDQMIQDAQSKGDVFRAIRLKTLKASQSQPK